MIRIFLAALACALLTACASPTTSALEPQNQALKGQQAKIYLIRPSAWAGRFITYDVKIDDKPVGKVAAGSYLSVNRPAGRHKITIKPLLDIASAEHEFQADAGQTYYFVVNIKASETAVVSGSFVMAIPIPGTSIGRRVGQRNFLSGIYLGVLDDAAGQAMLSQLKTP